MITHEIKKTDTLEGIALRYNVSIERIKKANKIYNKSTLLCLDKLLIPEEGEVLSPKSLSKCNSINILTDGGASNDFNNKNNHKNNNSNNYNNNYNDNYNNDIPYYQNINHECSSYPSSSRSSFCNKRSNSELSSMDELFESIDRKVMDTINKSNISLPLLIKSQLEVYHDIPTYNPNNDKTTTRNVLQKSNSLGCIQNNMDYYGNFNDNSKKNKNGKYLPPYVNKAIQDQDTNAVIQHSQSLPFNPSPCSEPKGLGLAKLQIFHSDWNSSQSSLSCAYDGYQTSDYDSPLTAESPQKSFLKNEQEKITKIFDKLSITTPKMDGIYNFVNRLSSATSETSNTEQSNNTNNNTNKKNNSNNSSNYLELAKIV